MSLRPGWESYRQGPVTSDFNSGRDLFDWLKVNDGDLHVIRGSGHIFIFKAAFLS